MMIAVYRVVLWMLTQTVRLLGLEMLLTKRTNTDAESNEPHIVIQGLCEVIEKCVQSPNDPSMDKEYQASIIGSVATEQYL